MHSRRQILAQIELNRSAGTATPPSSFLDTNTGNNGQTCQSVFAVGRAFLVGC